jgi:hypothetical protein
MASSARFRIRTKVVGGGGEGEHPTDSRSPSVAGLAQEAHGLHPTEDLFDDLAASLADRVAGVTGGALVDSTPPVRRVLGDVRGQVERTTTLDEALLVVASIAGGGGTAVARDGFQHRERRIDLRRPRSLGKPGVDDQAVPVLDQDVARIRQLR